MRKSNRRKLLPDGLPIDPLAWLEEDWSDLHEALVQIKKRISDRHAKVKAPAEPTTDWRDLYLSVRQQLLKLCGLMATTQRENEHEWMQIACDMLNECLAVLGDKDRLTYSREYGCFEMKA